MRDNLIHRKAEDGYASYGLNGGPGRYIMIAPSYGYSADKEFFGNFRSRDTSVVAVLEPSSTKTLPPSLKSLMDVWSGVEGGFYMFQQADTPSALSAKFKDHLLAQCKRKKINPTAIDLDAVDFLKREISKSLCYASVVFDPKQSVRLLMNHYAAGSEPVRRAHGWHNDFESAAGQVVMQQSFNVGGLQLQFKEQTNPGVIAGVSFAPGRVMFKVAEDSYHRGWPVSPIESRLMCAITGTPRPGIYHG